MKTISKYVLRAVLCFTVATASVSCDQLEEEFYNPDKITEPNFPLFFSSVQSQEHLFRYGYGPTYHYMRGFGKMLGLGVSPLYLDPSQNNTIVQPWMGWSGVPFNEDIFNKTNVNFSKDINVMKLLYNGMSDEDKKRNSVYISCADIIQGYAFQRSTDLYDDIPYFEVGGAFQEQFYAKYDTQEAIYMDIISRLKQAAMDLTAYEFVGEDRMKFVAADILCKGDIDRWIRFANSLRLRMSMRLCHVKPDVAIANIKELVQGNMMLTEYSHDIGFEEQDKVRAFENTFYRGIDERGYECGAPKTIIEDMMNYTYQEGDEIKLDRHDFDPRLYAIFQPDSANRYIGLPLLIDGAKEELKEHYTEKQINDLFNFEDAVVGSWDPNRICAMYNRRTYFNFDMQFPVMGSTETNLLLAEAAVRWPGQFGSVNAQECIKKAIDASTKFYYTTNSNMKYGPSTTPGVLHIRPEAVAPVLDEEHLSDYKVLAANNFAALPSLQDKLQFIFNQKFIHMNIMNPYELFNEARRLVKDFDGKLPLTATPNVVFQERMFYPSNEAINNADNFSVIAHKNTFDTPVWWTGRTEAVKNTNGNAF